MSQLSKICRIVILSEDTSPSVGTRGLKPPAEYIGATDITIKIPHGETVASPDSDKGIGATISGIRATLAGLKKMPSSEDVQAAITALDKLNHVLTIAAYERPGKEELLSHLRSGAAAYVRARDPMKSLMDKLERDEADLYMGKFYDQPSVEARNVAQQVRLGLSDLPDFDDVMKFYKSAAARAESGQAIFSFTAPVASVEPETANEEDYAQDAGWERYVLSDRRRELVWDAWLESRRRIGLTDPGDLSFKNYALWWKDNSEKRRFSDGKGGIPATIALLRREAGLPART